MTISDIVSSVALIASLVSLFFSIYLGLRDRPRLQIDSTLYYDPDNGPSYILISIRNIGRRKVIIRRLISQYDTRIHSITELGDSSSGIEIGENQWHEFHLDEDQLVTFIDNHVGHLIDLYIEDSHNRSYIVKNAKRNIKTLLAGWAKG
ncbi:MAG: hypothetical protein WCC12_10270 [Anaerolineales bacterium]